MKLKIKITFGEVDPLKLPPAIFRNHGEANAYDLWLPSPSRAFTSPLGTHIIRTSPPGAPENISNEILFVTFSCYM